MKTTEKNGTKKREFSATLLNELLGSCEDPRDLLKGDGLLHQLKGALMERILGAELEHHLGYVKHDPIGHGSGNSHNGKTGKTVHTETGPVEVNIPRDRNGTFEPQLIPKHTRRLEGFDDKVLSLYSRGMSMRDIQSHLRELYGTDVSPELISRVTDAVIEELKEWQNRPLLPLYPVLYLDALFVSVRDHGQVSKRAIYVALGVSPSGERDVLGMWVEANEGAKFWMQVLTDLRNRGVKDIFFVCCDGLTGFPKAIEAVFPQSIVQTCIVHMIRASLKYVTYGDRKAVVRELKEIYGAENEAGAERALTVFEEKYGRKYPAIGKQWRTRWKEVIPFLAFPREVRRVLYTTNAIESLNSQLRKVLRSKGLFPSDEAAMKLCFMAIQRAKLRWRTSPLWRQAMAQFAIMFGDRFSLEI
jgi:putative transposase